MSTITKEWLQKTIAEYEANRDELPFGLDTNSAIELQAFKIALASLEAEPVAWRRFQETPRDSGYWVLNDYKPNGSGVEPLYAAPPTPVAPEEMPKGLAGQIVSLLAHNIGDKFLAQKIWNVCRAAMLQGADTELQRKAAIHDALCEKYNVESLADFVDWQRNHIAELEAAPPAPVGKGETAVMPDYPGYTMTQRECFQAGKKAGLAEDGNSPMIPDGWVLVPIEPTEDMIVEGFESEPDESFSDADVWEAYEAMSGCQQAAHRAKLCYAAMIAAAPQQEVK